MTNWFKFSKIDSHQMATNRYTGLTLKIDANALMRLFLSTQMISGNLSQNHTVISQRKTKKRESSSKSTDPLMTLSVAY